MYLCILSVLFYSQLYDSFTHLYLYSSIRITLKLLNYKISHDELNNIELTEVNWLCRNCPSNKNWFDCPKMTVVARKILLLVSHLFFYLHYERGGRYVVSWLITIGLNGLGSSLEEVHPSDISHRWDLTFGLTHPKEQPPIIVDHSCNECRQTPFI